MQRLPAAFRRQISIVVRRRFKIYWIEIGSISVCLKGPFQGTRNTGRIYFPVYPQKIGGEDPFALVQKSIGVAPTKLYLVGYYHMRNELDPLETRELAELIDQWRDRIVVTNDHSLPGIVCHQR